MSHARDYFATVNDIQRSLAFEARVEIVAGAASCGLTSNALAMYGEPTAPSPVIGFAADGFPIYGPYFDDGVEIRAAVSGYTLRSGSRPTGSTSPGGTYDGSYVDEYELTGAGDLDECNGMMIEGQDGYYVTRSYPWVIGVSAEHRMRPF